MSLIIQSRNQSMLPTYLGVGLAILLIGVIGGIAVATGAKLLIVPVFGLVFGAIVLLLPVEWLVISLVALSFLIVGLVGYFAKINQIYWLPYILGLVIWLRTLVDISLRTKVKSGSWPFVIWVFLFYLLVLGINSVANPKPAEVYLISAKNYIFLLSAFLAGFVLIKQPRTYEQIWKFLLFVALIQLPVVAYQYVVIGGRITEAGGHGWDAVSGTFGGGETGGSSGFMGLYLVTILVLLIAMIRNGQMGKRWGTVLAVFCISPVFIGEVKAVFVIFLPVAFFWLFRKQIIKNPLQTGAGLLAFIVVMALGLMVYEKLHYKDSRSGVNRTLVERLEDAIILETDPYYVRKETGEVGRAALLVLWWKHHGLDEPDKLLFGHGLGSMRVSSFYIGDVQKQFPRQRLDRHAISVLLWDAGIVGTCSFILLLISGARLSLRLSKSSEIHPLHRAYLETSGIFLILALVGLVYNRDVLENSGMILLVMISLGQAVFWFNRQRVLSKNIF